MKYILSFALFMLVACSTFHGKQTGYIVTKDGARVEFTESSVAVDDWEVYIFGTTDSHTRIDDIEEFHIKRVH